MRKNLTQFISLIAVSSLLSSYLLYAADDDEDEKKDPSSSSSLSSGHSSGQLEAENPQIHAEISCDPEKDMMIQKMPAELTAIVTSYLPIEDWENLHQTELAIGKSLAVSRVKHLTIGWEQSVIKTLTYLLENAEGIDTPKNKTLKSLDASHVKLTPSDMEFITSRFPQLEILNLRGCFGLLDESEKIESLSYLKRLEHIQTLNLSGHWFENTELTVLLTSLIRRGTEAKPSGLTKLDLDYSVSGVEQLSTLARNLRDLPLLTELSVEGNDLRVEGLKAFAESLGHRSKLKKLDLGSNNLGEEGAQYLATLLAHTPELTELSLSSNHLGEVGLKALAKGLAHTPLLRSLDIGLNSLGAAMAEDWASALAHTPELTDLNVRYNNLEASGLKALAEGLGRRSKLKKLDLGINNLKGEAAQHLATLLAHTPELTKLNVANNKLGAVTTEDWRSAFIHTPLLKHLNVRSCNLKLAGLRALANALVRTTPLLEYLFVENNDFEAEAETAVAIFRETHRQIKIYTSYYLDHVKFERIVKN